MLKFAVHFSYRRKRYACDPISTLTRPVATPGGFFISAYMNPIHIEYRPIDSLIPYARNAKQHPDAQVAQIAASIREFGWSAPILVD